MGTVYKSFEVHAKKKKRLCCCGVTVRCDSGESSGKKKKEMCRESIHMLREYKNTYVQNVDRNSGH